MTGAGTMWRLIENESVKIVRRRRFTIAVAILAAVLSLVAYGQYRQLERSRDREWRVDVQQRIAAYQNRLRRGTISQGWARSLRAEIARLQYHLDRGINPEKPTGPLFVRTFAAVGGYLLLPLLVAVIGSDIVSAETAEGTDKLLLTRPVKRWKILLSKAMALFAWTTLVLLAGGCIAYLAGAVALDPRGWNAPVFTGFRVEGETIRLDDVRQLPLWLDTVLAYGLEWFSLLAVASIALALSVLFRTSAASMGTMLAALIGGTILTRLNPDWTAAKYFFVTALPVASYYSGEPPPYDGMTLTFCVALLAVWAAASLALAFIVYIRRDILG